LPQTNQPSALSTESRSPTHLSGWVPVVEVEDPRAPVVFYALIARAPRFTSFVTSPTGEQIPVVEDLSAI
jgi:hypothetical protein